MHPKQILVIALLALSTFTFAQNTGTNSFSRLLGTWKGEGDGTPGKGGGTFTFAYDLDKKVITRKAHSEYPATDNKPLIIHDDLMVIYADNTGAFTKAIYFDNEGHTINYNITYTDKNIVLLGDKMPGMPVFKLTYTLPDNETVNTKFEMSKDGTTFFTYVEGNSKRGK